MLLIFVFKKFFFIVVVLAVVFAFVLMEKEETIFDMITPPKIKFFVKDFFRKCDQICRKLRIWSHCGRNP